MIDRSRLIGADARAVLDVGLADLPDDRATGQLMHRTRSLKVLERELDSFPRLLWGALAWLAAVAGGAGLASGLWHGLPIALRVVGPLLGAALIVLGVLFGLRVRAAGRDVIDAYAAWTLLPERLPEGGAGYDGWRSSPVRDAVQARVWVFEGWRPLRIGLAALSGLAGAAFARLLEDSPARQVRWDNEQPAAVGVFVVVLVVVGLTAAAIVLGGMFRASRAQSERDPVTRRLLGRDR